MVSNLVAPRRARMPCSQRSASAVFGLLLVAGVVSQVLVLDPLQGVYNMTMAAWVLDSTVSWLCCCGASSASTTSPKKGAPPPTRDPESMAAPLNAPAPTPGSASARLYYLDNLKVFLTAVVACLDASKRAGTLAFRTADVLRGTTGRKRKKKGSGNGVFDLFFACVSCQ